MRGGCAGLARQAGAAAANLRTRTGLGSTAHATKILRDSDSICIRAPRLHLHRSHNMIYIPPDIQAVITVGIGASQVVAAFVVVFGAVVVGKYPEVVAPLNPSGPLGRATGVVEYFAAVYDLGEADVRAAGGVDAALNVRRLAMRVDLCALWTLASIPVCVWYAVNEEGNTAGGFARASLANAEPRRGPYDFSKLWAMTAGMYVMVLAAWRVVGVYDDAAEKLIKEAAAEPRPADFVVVATAVPPSDDAAKVGEALGGTAVLVPDLSRAVATDEETRAVAEEAAEAEQKLSALGGTAGGVAAKARAKALAAAFQPGGVRERTRRLVAAYRAGAKAEAAAAAHAAKKPPSDAVRAKAHALQGELAAKARVSAREACDKARASYMRAAAAPVANSAAAVVEFRSGAEAAAATSSTAYDAAPAPEARDIHWARLEKCGVDPKSDKLKAAQALVVKGTIYLFYSIILTALEVLILYLMRLAAGLGGPVATVLAAAALIVPTFLKSFMLGFMATILRAVDEKFEMTLWTESALQKSCCDSYVFFLALIGFLAPLLGGNLLAAAYGSDADPAAIPHTAALSMGGAAYANATLILLKCGGLVSGLTRVVPFFVYRAKLAFLATTDEEVQALTKPQTVNVAPLAGWESFAFLLAAVYMPVAPYVVVICLAYLALQRPAVKAEICAVNAFPYDTRGELWSLSVDQTWAILAFALALQFLVVLVFGGDWRPAVAALPAFGVLVDGYRRSLARRAATKAALAAIQEGKGAEDAEAAAPPTCEWLAPEALPAAGSAVAEAALPGPPRADGEDLAARVAAAVAYLERNEASASTAAGGAAAKDLLLKTVAVDVAADHVAADK